MLRDMQGGTKAKIENPEYLTLKKNCKVLMDGNKKGSQKLTQAQIEVAKIKAAGKETSSLEQRIDTFSQKFWQRSETLWRPLKWAPVCPATRFF